MDFPDGAVLHLKEETLVACLWEKMNGNIHPCAKYISEVDVFDHEPQQLPALSKLGTKNDEWYFFFSRQKLYKKGTVWKRKTKEGNWHETGGRKKVTVAMRRIFVFHIERKKTAWRLYEFEIDEGRNMLVGLLKKIPVENGKRKEPSSDSDLENILAPSPSDHALVTEVIQSEYGSDGLMNNPFKRNKTSDKNAAFFSEVNAASEVQWQLPYHMQTWDEYLKNNFSSGGSATTFHEKEFCADTTGYELMPSSLDTNVNPPPQQALFKNPIEQGMSVKDNSITDFSPHSQNMPQYPSSGTAENETPEDRSRPSDMPLFSPGQTDTNFSLYYPNDFSFNSSNFFFPGDAENWGQLKLGETSNVHETKSCHNENTSELLNDTHDTESLGSDLDVYPVWSYGSPMTAIGGLSSNSA